MTVTKTVCPRADLTIVGFVETEAIDGAWFEIRGNPWEDFGTLTLD